MFIFRKELLRFQLSETRAMHKQVDDGPAKLNQLVVPTTPN